MVGQPLGIYWGAQTDGIYADWEEAINSGIAGAAPGEIKYLNNYVDVDESKGDWYFTGDYPTPGGNRVVNTAFVNFYEGNKKRAY